MAVSEMGSQPMAHRSTSEIIQSLPGVIFKPEIHNSGYYTGPQNILPAQTKDDCMGMQTNSRSALNQYCCQKKSLSDYTLRQGTSKMLNFFFVFISLKLTHPNKQDFETSHIRTKTDIHSKKINSQTAEAIGL